jgi:cyclophilin family peptidyl-prolyl cis-trans isomerase
MTNDSFEASTRRQILTNTAMLIGTITTATSTLPANAAVRAVGSAEKACQEAGDCIQKGDWDAAVGWQWGGKDRCDPLDPQCGPDGKLRDTPLKGEPVPEMLPGVTVTHIVVMNVKIGREETGTIRFGLYGEACPKSVAELVDVLSPSGLITGSKLMLEDGYGVVSAAVTLGKGYGLLTTISPNQRLVFGVPSQAAAYAKSIGSSKAGDAFQPQSRPREQLNDERSPRDHTVAGLISIPGGGVGYADNSSDDEAFNSAFEITAGVVPSMDREHRKVVGQVLDEESMAFVARLASLPTKKGIKGIIPGQNSGPPLLKTIVKDVQVTTTPSATPPTEVIGTI